MNTGSIHIIANPTSGRGKGRRLATALADRLREHGRTVELSFTTAAGEAENVAAEACHRADARPAILVACGGDGTMQEVANAVARARVGADLRDDGPAMAVAPAGRCNDLARALGVGRTLEQAADCITNGVRRPIDLGCVNGRYYCTVATLGVDADVSCYVDTMRMPLRGTPAYIYGAARVLLRYRGRRMRVTDESGTTEGMQFLLSIANTPSYGGDIHIVPHASPFDGQLDVCSIRAVSRVRAFMVLLSVLRRRHESLPEHQCRPARSLRVDTDTPSEIWADGERIGHTPADITVHPAALPVLLPAGSRLLC